MHAAVRRECVAARRSVAIMDASTLGKIDIRGKDVREFLERVYANAWTQLAPGKCRYGLMLDENGMVMDDGVTACIADDHFHMTTTTGGAARVLTWLEKWHQTEWPDLDVYMTSVTDHWATAAVVGPKSPRGAGEGLLRHRACARRVQVHGLARGDGCRRSGAGVPHQLLGRTRLRSQRRRELWGSRLGGADGGRARI